MAFPRVESTMAVKFDLIDIFSHRPSLSPLAHASLKAALDGQFPLLDLDPDVAALTRVTDSGQCVTETLIACLRRTFPSGKTPVLHAGRDAFQADPRTRVAEASSVDVEQLAIVIDSVALDLLDAFSQALIRFWDSPGADGISPGRQLAAALAQQSPGAGLAPGDDRVADFERRAMEVLDAQLAAIQGVPALGLADFDEVERYLAKVTDIGPLLKDEHSATIAQHISRLDQLPSWLTSASSTNRLDYSRKLSAVAVVAEHAAGASWDEGLPPILEYARKVLQDRLREDHPEAGALTLDDVTVSIAKVVAAAVPSGGQIFSGGSVEHQQLSVARFALGNLCSVPSGTLTLSMRDGGPPPAWLNADYLKQLVVRVDIGSAYPALVRRLLLTDPLQAARRQRLFADQLRVQLPLKALEQTLRGEGHMTRAGYRLVCSLLTAGRDNTVDQAVLRPLGFVAHPGAGVDEVCNVFVIGPADVAVGPFVLYRPFAQVPLTEFASWSLLRAAIASPGALQDEVLAWMSQHGRQRYAQGGFDQPHIVRFGLGSEFAPLEVPAPAQLSVTQVHGEALQALFNANARALVDLADRESVSNAESRWALIQRAGWLALDLVMPFLSGSLGKALWLVQLMVAAQQVLVTQRPVANRDEGQAWSALLLTISMILLHQGYRSRLPVVGIREPNDFNRVELPSSTDVSPHEGAALARHEASASHAASLDFSWANLSHRLTQSQAQRLAQLRILPEPALGASSAAPGRAGLYQFNQQWFVQLDSGIYAVGFAEESIHIIDPRHPELNGPRVKRIDGTWALDLSLGLRGGGPKRNVRQMALENAAALKRVFEQDIALEQRKRESYQRFAELDKSLRDDSLRLTPQLCENIEADLNELGAIFQERMSLQETLRPADRVGEKPIALNLQGICRRAALYEGALVASLVSLVRNRLPQLQATESGVLVPAKVDDYLALFEEMLILKDRGVHWSGIREGYWQQLRAVPKLGETYWREEVLELQRTNMFTHLEWRGNRLWSLLELSLTKDILLEGAVAVEFKQLRNDEVLHEAFSSHAELEKPNNYTPAEQIDVLESSLREYQRCRLIAVSARETAPENFEPVRFERFLEDLAWITERAETRLSDLIRESAEPPEQFFEYAPKVSQSRKRVFKTRTHRTLVGRLKEGEPGLPGAVVEVTQTMADNVVGTYHLHEDGEWVEVQNTSAPKPLAREATATLAELKRQAAAAIQGLESSIDTARRQSRRAEEPADMQDILTHKAERLESLADRLASQAAKSTQEQMPGNALQALIEQLRSGAARLIAEGRALRIAMIKAQPPTEARLAYLAQEREVDIVRFDGRKNMSGAKRNDFLQEYVIRDKEQRELWWAHFHYPSEDAGAEAFSAAHLKLPAQRFIGYKAQVKAAKDNKEVISVYRSTIGKDLARRLFLHLAG